MPPRAILFDLGDTLWGWPGDSPAEAVPHFQSLLHLFDGIEPPPAELLYEALMQRYARDREESTLPERKGVQTATAVLAREAFAPLGFEPPFPQLQAFAEAAFHFEAAMAANAPEAAENAAVLQALRARGLRLGVVSNTIASRSSLERILDVRGLMSLVEHVGSSADLGYRKPHPECFLPTIRALGTAPEESIFVGDRHDTDIEGALELGMTAVLTHQYRREDSAEWPHKPHHTIAHLRDLIALAESML
jgi:putative hydrolase of the HAD superfamily